METRIWKRQSSPLLLSPQSHPRPIPNGGPGSTSPPGTLLFCQGFDENSVTFFPHTLAPPMLHQPVFSFFRASGPPSGVGAMCKPCAGAVSVPVQPGSSPSQLLTNRPQGLSYSTDCRSCGRSGNPPTRPGCGARTRTRRPLQSALGAWPGRPFKPAALLEGTLAGRGCSAWGNGGRLGFPNLPSDRVSP